MHYLIDGYNLLFSLDESSNLRLKREELIEYLSEKFSALKLTGFIVFDGSHRRDELSGRCYGSPLEIVYSPKGQSADCYIVETVEFAKNPKEILVITNDTGLKKRARAHLANTQGTKAFLNHLAKKSKKAIDEKSAYLESTKNFNRLLKIFEERLDEAP